MAINNNLSEQELTVVRKGLGKIGREWWVYFFCWLLLFFIPAAIFIWGIMSGKVQRFEDGTTSTEPLIDELLGFQVPYWATGLVFYGLAFIPSIPLFFRFMFGRFHIHPDFEVTETTITWSDGRKTSYNDSMAVGFANILFIAFRFLVGFVIVVLILAPINFFIILPYKARTIRKEFGVKGFKYGLGNLLFILLVLLALGSMIVAAIIKFAPEAIAEASASLASAASESAIRLF